MPDFTVTSPDGKTHKISGPPGSTQQDAIAEVQRQLGTTSAPPSPSGAVEGKPYVADPRSFGQTVGEGLSAVGQDLGGAVRGIADFFKAPGDVVMGKYGNAGDPRLTEKARGEALGFAGAGAPVARPLIEAGARGLGTAAEIAAKPVTGPAALIGNATGRGAATASEGLRTGALGEAGKAIATKEGEAAPLDARAAAIAKAQGQLADQPAKAADKVAAAGRLDEKTAAQRERGEVPDLLRPAVLKAARQRRADTVASYRDVGATPEEAEALTTQADAKVSAAQQAVTEIEQKALATPGITDEQIGGQVRAATKSLYDKFDAIRRKEAGFGEAISGAGRDPILDTKPIIDRIDTMLQDNANPQLKSTLEYAKEQLATGGNKMPAINIARADSLRKTLDSAIASRQFSSVALDRDTVYNLQSIRHELANRAGEAWAPYKQALTKYGKFSRPLDIVERKGALKKVLDNDPLSTEYAWTEAQVAGQVIAKARQGNPVFSRLLEQDPDLRRAAKLYFTHDLFGTERQFPTASRLRSWLQRNQKPLEQAGIYQDFRDIKTARETAQAAVEEAKGSKLALESRQAEAAAAKKRANSFVGKVLDRKTGLAQGKGEPANPDRHVLSQRIIEPKDRELSGRAKQAQSRLVRTETDIKGQAEAKRAMADDFRKFRTEITRARPKEVPANTRAFVSQLRDKNMISDVEYDRYLKQIQGVEDKFKATAEARKRLIKIGATAAGLAGLAEGVNVTRGLTGR